MRSFLLGAKTEVQSWTNPYVTDGLVAYWDGEWNAGGGKHDASVEVWKDIAGGHDFLFNEEYLNAWSWGEDSLQISDRHRVLATAEIGAKEFRHIDVCFRCGNPLAAEWLLVQSSNKAIWGYRNGSGVGIVGYSSKSWNYNLTAGWAGTVSAGYGDITGDAQEASQDYFYGKSVGGFSITGPIDYWTSPSDMLGKTTIGYQQNPNWPFIGEIMSIRMYSRALTASEIASNYAIDARRFGL